MPESTTAWKHVLALLASMFGASLALYGPKTEERGIDFVIVPSNLTRKAEMNAIMGVSPLNANVIFQKKGGFLS